MAPDSNCLCALSHLSLLSASSNTWLSGNKIVEAAQAFGVFSSCGLPPSGWRKDCSPSAVGGERSSRLGPQGHPSTTGRPFSQGLFPPTLWPLAPCSRCVGLRKGYFVGGEGVGEWTGAETRKWNWVRGGSPPSSPTGLCVVGPGFGCVSPSPAGGREDVKASTPVPPRLQVCLFVLGPAGLRGRREDCSSGFLLRKAIPQRRTGQTETCALSQTGGCVWWWWWWWWG